MLNANSTRDLNQAARAAEKYLKEHGIELSHAKALDLIARTTGKPSHMAAQAPLVDVGLQAPVTINNYADLMAALSLLTAQQLAMSITVSEGCDENGNAEFFPGYSLMRADSRDIHAATDGQLEPAQPVMLFNGPDLDSDYEGTRGGRSSMLVGVVEDLCKILTNKSVDLALYSEGISDAAYDALAQAAPYVANDVLAKFSRDSLQRAYDTLPVTQTPKAFLAGEGNWGLSEDEALVATRLAELITAAPKATAATTPETANSVRSKPSVFYREGDETIDDTGWFWALIGPDFELLEGSQGTDWDGPYATQDEATEGSTCNVSREQGTGLSSENLALARIEAQFEMSMGRSPGVLHFWLKTLGATAAIRELNKRYDTAVAIGPFVISSETEHGFWCNGFGWTSSKLAATGYYGTSYNLSAPGFPSDATLVAFKGAKDFDVE